MVPTFFGITLVMFALVQSVPGNPLLARFGGGGEAMSGGASADVIERMREQYNLDKPIPVQYAYWVSDLARLDFGISLKDDRPVWDKMLDALPITLQLSLISIVIAFIIAIPIGTYSATHPQSILDRTTTFILFLLYSLPSFWVAMLLIMFLGGGQWLDLFPTNGMSSLEADKFGWFRWTMDRVWHLALPLVCYTYTSLAVISRYMRTGMLDVIRQDYIRTARAYGFSERIVVFRYAMRNSLIPIITLIGAIFPTLIGGSIIIESIFSLPGMGRLMFDAMLFRDYPTIMGVTTFVAVMTLVGLVLADVLYAVVDPRIRLG